MPLNEFLQKNKSLFLVFLLFLIITSIMQFRIAEIIGYDGYFHIKMAEITKTQGFIKEFPYTTESILADSYANLHLLFHIILIPFTYFGLMLGAKLASILFSSLCFTFFYWYLKKNKISFPLFWTSLYAIASVGLMYRFLEPRQMPLAILLLVLTLYFIDEKMYKSLLLTSLLFTWLYSGFVFQLLVIILYFLINLLINKKLDFKLLIFPAMGILLALITNPYFPANLSLLYTQLFKVNLLGNLYNAEWKPWSFIELLRFNWILLILFFLSLLAVIKTMKLDKKSLLFLVLSAIFLIAMLKTRRMQEYFAPFAVLFASFTLNPYIVKLNEKKALKYMGVVIIVAIAIFSLLRLNSDIKNNNFLPWYAQGTEYFKTLPHGSKIFINAYTFNYLFFNAPDYKYTHGLDLTYSYLKDPAKFDRYIQALQGKDPGFNIIKQDYNADYAFIGKLKQDIQLFNHVVAYKEDFEVLYEDDSAGILKVKK